MKLFINLKAFAIILLLLGLIPFSYGHQLFNSEGRRIAGYIMQVATEPEIPTVGGQSKIMFKITHSDFNEVMDAKIGMRIYKDDVLLKEIHPRILSNGHFEIDYTFTTPGIHIIEIELYTLTGNMITERFNVSSLNPFGYIFYSMVLVGVLFPTSLFGFLCFMERRKKQRFTV